METFDYVIAGGGSAGSVLANRLSESGHASVLLLEAGRNWRSAEAPEEIRSLNFFHAFACPDFFWKDLKGRLTSQKKPEQYFVGKGLGGGSTVNALFYVRPPLSDFDRWEALGCRGWSGSEVQGYFVKAETDQDFADRPWHGGTGPMPVWRPPRESWKPLDRAFHAAASEHGHGEAADLDFNAPGASGITVVPFNVLQGRRVSTNDAYLEPVRERANLTILGDALVEAVTFDGRKATGVKATVRGAAQTFSARRVVLSAGAIFTPAILIRSGIGPAAQVRALGTGLVSERPGVGRLFDHPLLTVTFRLKPDFRAARPAPRDFYSSIILSWSSGSQHGLRNDLNVHTQAFIGTNEAALETGGLVLGLGSVYSMGKVEVESTDPRQCPFVDVGMLSDTKDLVRLREGVRHLFELVRKGPMKEAIDGEAKLAPRGAEGRPVSSFKDDEDLEAAILAQCAQYFHPVGTCRMGSPEDPMTVVDPWCRVLGTDGLFVADASIMPEIVRCNTNATTIMIAERAAELLKAN